MKFEELIQTVTFILCLIASGVVLPMGLVLFSATQFTHPLPVLPEPVIIFEASSSPARLPLLLEDPDIFQTEF
jgi:hypothetical protein